MSKIEKESLYFTTVDGNNIVKIPSCELNTNTDCLYENSTIKSTLAEITTRNQDTCELIQILEDSGNEHETTKHVNQSIHNTNIVVYESTKNSEKKVPLDDESNDEGHKSNVLYEYNKGYLMSGCDYNAKSDINVNSHKYKDHNYSDITNNEKLKNTLQPRKMLNNYANYNVPPSTSDNKNMFVSNKTALVSEVKNINDLKKVIPKVKILGAEVNTLKELTQSNSNNKFNIMESKIHKMNDSRVKLDNYCRTCAGLKIPLVDIFSDRGVQMRLNQQMKHLENIDQQDSLSTQMCMDCICDLKMSYKFFMQIKKAEVKLKSIYATMNTSTSARLIENQSNIKYENHSTNLYKSDNAWKTTNQLSQQQSLTSVAPTNSEYVYDESGSESKKLIVESANNWKDNNHDNYDDTVSIEEFDPDDDRFESVDYTNIVTESDIGINNEEDTLKKQLSHNENISVKCANTTEGIDDELIDNISKGSMKKESIGQLVNIGVDNSIKIESESIVYEPSSQSFTAIDRDVTRECVKQPNILKRKASWPGKCTNFVNTPDSSAKEAKIHKLNTVNISPSDEEGIMYVTVKGSKPNELLLVKVKKMDKISEKKDDKNLVKKTIDSKCTEKSLKDIFCDRSKKLENREAIIEEQIEQYKKKREKVLGGGTGTDAAAALIASASATVSASNSRKSIDEVDNDGGSLRFISFSNNFMENSLLDNEKSLKVEPIENENGEKENIEIKHKMETLNENEIDSQENNEEHNNEYKSTEDYLARLTVIKQKWEEAKLKKESLQKELDDSYTEGNLEKLSRILGEKEKNLQEFQEYLKQRKIVITRLKDEDIISLYEDRNVAAMQNKLPDIIDENPTLHNIGDSNFFDCDYCSQIFGSRGALEEHLKTHDYKIPYFCEDCGSEFPNNKTRRAHNITCLKKLICKYCDFMLESKGKKRQHEQKHCDAIYGQLCDVCGEKFKHQGTLDQHIKTQHMSWEKVFQCPKCPKKFAFKQKLSFHLKSVHTTLRAYLCEDCGADFKNPASLRHHRIRKHQPTSNKRECPVCHKLVPFYSLSKHMYTHKAYTIECPHCDKMFKNTSTLKQHVRIHEDQRQYRCDTCGVGFNRRDGLRLHMRVHQKSDSRALKECSCQICSEKFPNHSMLVIHRNRVHKDGRQYTCHICNRSMLSTRSLEWHMSHIHNQTPTGITPDDSEVAIEMKRVSCNHCDKTFKTEMILRTHIKNTHMEKNPVKCSDCDLMFTSEVRLRHHMMIVHNRLEGTLTCPHCPKRFVNQLRLKTHMISHSEERPYTCEICGFNLKTKIQLIKHHQNRHSDERPLQCRYCPWRCKQVSALVCHERTHTNERPYSCIVCKQRFKYLGDKNKHERRHESLGGSGFKRIVAGRNVKQLKNQDGDVSASENDPLDPDYDNIDDNLNEQHVEYDIKYDEDQQIVKFEADEVDVQDQIEHHEQIIEEEEEEEEEEEDYEEEGEEEEDEEQRQQHEQEVVEAEIDDEEYKQVYQHEYEEISRETSDAAEVIMNMEDATVYTEEVTADNIENAEMITAEMMTNQILQSGTVVHIQQQDDDGKIQMIPVMLSLPDLTDSTAEINLATGSIIYNN